MSTDTHVILNLPEGRVPEDKNKPGERKLRLRPKKGRGGERKRREVRKRSKAEKEGGGERKEERKRGRERES